jgi:hypothetical protein
MWFILFFGVLTVGAAARFAWRGEHQLAQFIRWMTLTTLACSLLGWGTAMMITVLSYVVHRAPPEERWVILVQGTMEALNVPTFGLLFMVLARLLLAVGYRRFPMPNV